MGNDATTLLRRIPAVTQLLASTAGAALVTEFGEGVTKFELRRVLDELRQQIRGGVVREVPDIAGLAFLLRRELTRLTRPASRQAINGTGILLHTGLGRAPLAPTAVAAVTAAAEYTVLQASLQTGDRSLREQRVEQLLIELTGCEAATVVNNNAAATMLVLNTLAAGREVIVSRGQLVEIGGSFRLPDVMARSGAILREVGTTNRTHLRDYEEAIGENTGAIIHVHTSNYRIRGFSGTPGVRELCELGRRRQVPVIDDLGSGALVPLQEFGLTNEPLVPDSVAAGADLICFSGDKLICGPQSGLICGREAVVARARKNPFARMFRVCKLTLAGLEATLLHFVNGDYRQALPLYQMLGTPLAEVEARAERLLARLGQPGIAGLALSKESDQSYIGSGSLPDEGLPTCVVSVRRPGLSPDELARRLRLGLPPVFARIRDDAVVLDLRSISPEQLAPLAACLRQALDAGPAPGVAAN